MEHRKEYLKNIIKEMVFNNKQLSVKECAKYLDKHPITILRAIRNGDIWATKIRKTYIIPQLQFLKYK